MAAMDRRSWTLVAVVLGSGTVFLDSTVVNVALKAIGRDLPGTLVATLEGQNYVLWGYLLTLSSLLILAGSLADRYGRRRMFLIGIAGFGVSSMLCGVAPSMELLIVVRLLQGAFGALLVPTSLAIITATFEGVERGRAFGIWAAATSATMLFGPVLGGFLTDAISWRAVFLINAPIVLVALYAGAQLAESRDPAAGRRFDWLGAAVVAIAVGGLTFGAIRGQQQQWQDPLAWSVLAIGAVATVALPPLMLMRRNPLVPPDLFRSRNFTVTNISTFLIYGAIYLLSSLMALFIQGTLGYTALAAGLTGLPTSILLTAFSTSVGTVAARWGPRWFMAAGPALMGVGLLWLARLPASSEPWMASVAEPATLLPSVGYWVDLFPAIVVFAVGLTIMVAPLTTALMSSVPERNSGLASAINNAISRVGPLLAGAVIFVAISLTFYGTLGSSAPSLGIDRPEVRHDITPLNAPERNLTPAELDAVHAASTDAFHLAMLIAALLCFAGAATNAVGIQNLSLRHEAGPEPEPRAA